MLQYPYKYTHNMQGLKENTKLTYTHIRFHVYIYIILTEVLLIIQVAYPSLYLAHLCVGLSTPTTEDQAVPTGGQQTPVHEYQQTSVEWFNRPENCHLLYHLLYTTEYTYACLHIYIYMNRERVLSYIHYLHINIYVLCMSM